MLRVQPQADPSTKPETVQVSFYLPVEDQEWLKALAQERDRTFSAELRRLIHKAREGSETGPKRRLIRGTR